MSQVIIENPIINSLFDEPPTAPVQAQTQQGIIAAEGRP
jgi:hypothetical protein